MDGLMPSRALLGAGRADGSPASPPSAPFSSAAASRSSALIRSHCRFTSAAVRATASPKTCGWRRTILRAIDAWTSARSNTPASAASCACRITWRSRSPSSSASAGVAPVLEGVVDLVRLLEQVLAQRGVGLLPVPRTAVGLAQAVADVGHRPRARRRRARARWAPRTAGRSRSAADRSAIDVVVLVASASASAPSLATVASPGYSRRSSAQRVAALGPVAAREQPAAPCSAAAPAAGTGPPSSAIGTMSSGREASIGVAISRSAGDDLDPRRDVEAPAIARLGDEGVEHRPGQAVPAGVPSVYSIVAASFWRVYQVEKPLSLKIFSCSSVGVRVSSATIRNR